MIKNSRAQRPWLLWIVLALLSLNFSWQTAIANELYADFSTCTTPDCNATIIPGYLNGYGEASAFPNVQPWVGKVFAAAEECLRLRVISQSTNTEMVVIAANGNAYRNDSSGIAPCPNCPLIKIKPGAVGGWHIVQISHATGSVVSGPFKLSYGRYAKSNPNCASPTPPVP